MVTWLEYVNACYTWNVFDANLTTQDIDRLFIATNYEETDLENNDLILEQFFGDVENGRQILSGFTDEDYIALSD